MTAARWRLYWTGAGAAIFGGAGYVLYWRLTGAVPIVPVAGAVLQGAWIGLLVDLVLLIPRWRRFARQGGLLGAVAVVTWSFASGGPWLLECFSASPGRLAFEEGLAGLPSAMPLGVAAGCLAGLGVDWLLGGLHRQARSPRMPDSQAARHNWRLRVEKLLDRTRVDDEQAQADYARRLRKHQSRFQCHVCGAPSTGPALVKHSDGALAELEPDWSSPRGVERCIKCYEFTCSEHLHMGICRSCACRM